MDHSPMPDRRAHPRYLCWVEVLCEMGPRPARLLDLSAGGARVALLGPLPPGAELRLTLSGAGGKPRVLNGQVTRVNRTTTGWEAGCTFSEQLTESQLSALLQVIEAG